MKKLWLLFIAVVSAALVMGCGSAPASSSSSNLPDWFDELPPADEIWGIGIANMSNPSLAVETATTRAQRDAARQLNTIVQGMLTDYANTSGLAENPRSMVSIENIGRNMINMSLTGSAINKRSQVPDGTWFVRVAVKKADATRQAASLIDNEFADFAEYRREQALGALDSAISSTQFRSEGLRE